VMSAVMSAEPNPICPSINAKRSTVMSTVMRTVTIAVIIAVIIAEKSPVQ
jgi:hypothetical protein